MPKSVLLSRRPTLAPFRPQVGVGTRKEEGAADVVSIDRRAFVLTGHARSAIQSQGFGLGLGDAELIQVMKADHGSLQPDECICGSIDDERVKAPVETILEGGTEAFQMRPAKYGF